MAVSLVYQPSNEEFEEIVNNSNSYTEIGDKLGYSFKSGAIQSQIKKRIEELNLSVEHFKRKSPVIRTEENIFIKDSTASQKVLREWYKKGEYTEYKCSICGQEPIWQGKDLTLILDHINGSNHDDRLENLRWVCPNCNQQLETTGFKIMRSKKEEIKNYCIDCGKEIFHGSIRCAECKAKIQIIPLEKMEVTRKELKQLIRTVPFTVIGEKFKVTDNAIRKWCDKFNLPRTKKEINSYSNEEWELI